MSARAAKSAAAEEIAAIVRQTVADEAMRIGADAFKKFADEIETRPLLMLGIAAGIGFVFGMANRR
jgi:ElaB/YqjD/DUF883 family membrane-anchored ribosome-binding protein